MNGRLLSSLFVVSTFIVALIGLGGCGDSSPEIAAAPPGWSAPQTLGSTDYVGSLSGDGSGNASLVWLAPAAGDLGGPIVSRRFAPRTEWGLAATIDPAGDRIFQAPVAGMDPQGRTVVLWPEQTGLFASRDTGTGWSPKARISREYGHSFHAQQGIGLSAMGSALGLWSAGAARITEIASNRFDPASGWSSPEVVWAAGADDLTNPALAVASSGLALAAWAEGFGSDRRLWWTTFDPKRGWAVAQTVGLAAPPRLQIYGVSVALNASGQGFITWIQDDTAFASRYTTVEGPAAPEGLGQGGVGGLEVDADGNGAAVLNQPLGQPPGLMFRRFRTGANAWDPPQPLAPEDTGGVGTLSMDTRGNAWILWCERRGVWARRFDLTRGLLPPEQISPESGTIPQVVADSEGGAMAVWVEVTGSPYTIKASRYTPR